MILDQELTVEQRMRSQRNLYYFTTVNGLAYMCVGETIMILLAVKLDFPDYVVAILSGMIFFGFLLLPLGKTVTAVVGGAKCQAFFWIARNIAALAVASAWIWSLMGMKTVAICFMVVGAFLFYGFRAAGGVMVQPLMADIATEQERTKLIATNSGLFYAACFVSLVVISILMKVNDSVRVLTLIIVVGSILGMMSSRFLHRIDETKSIIESARRPMTHEIVEAFQTSALRRLLFSSFISNLAMILLFPVAILVLKKGYGFSDTGALLFSLLQFASCTAMSFASGKISEKVGPRRTMIMAYITMLGVVALWICIPSSGWLVIPLCAFLFIMGGAFRIGIETSVVHYFLQTIPAERRVASSMLLNMITGVCAGVVGMVVSGSILYALGKTTDSASPGPEMLSVYKKYYALVFILLSPCLIFLTRLDPLPIEKRKIKRSWWHG